MHCFPNWVTSSPLPAPVSISQKDCSLSPAQHAANGGQCRYQTFTVQEQGSLDFFGLGVPFPCSHSKSLMEPLTSEFYGWSHCTTSILGAAVHGVSTSKAVTLPALFVQTWLSPKKQKSTSFLCAGGKWATLRILCLSGGW